MDLIQKRIADFMQRKRILNMPRLNIGNNIGNIRPQQNYQLSYQSPYDYSLTQNSFSLNKPISLKDGKIGNTGTDNFKPIDNPGKSKSASNTEAFDNVMAIGNGALSIGQNMMSSLNVPGTSEIVNNAGQSNNSVIGVNYQEQNVVDGSQELKEQDSKGLSNTASSTVSGAAAGAKVGGIWGGVIGGVVGLGSGLFGWLGGKSKLKRRIRRAKMAAANKASLQRSNALTQGLQNEYYLNNDNTADDILYT